MNYSQFFPQTLSRPSILNMKLNPGNLLTITPRYNLPRRGQTVVTKPGHDPMGPKPWTQLHSFHSYLGVARFWHWQDMFFCGFDSFPNEDNTRENTSRHCQILPKYNNSLSRQNVAIADSALQNTACHLEDKCIQPQDFVLICFRCIELPWSGAQMEP